MANYDSFTAGVEDVQTIDEQLQVRVGAADTLLHESQACCRKLLVNTPRSPSPSTDTI